MAHDRPGVFLRPNLNIPADRVEGDSSIREELVIVRWSTDRNLMSNLAQSCGEHQDGPNIAFRSNRGKKDLHAKTAVIGKEEIEEAAFIRFLYPF
jgi:hypothetical protein